MVVHLFEHLERQVAEIGCLLALRDPNDAALDNDTLLDLTVGLGRIRSAVSAVEAEALDWYARSYPASALYPSRMEYACAANLTEDQSGNAMFLASQLMGPLSSVHEAWAHGEIDLRHVRVFESVLRPLVTSDREEDVLKATHLAKRAIDFAKTHTSTETRRKLLRWLITADPRSAEQRRAQAFADREVTHSVLEDGIGVLIISGPVELTYRAYKGIDGAARFQSGRAQHSDERTLAQHRADLVLDMFMEAVTPVDSHDFAHAGDGLSAFDPVRLDAVAPMDEAEARHASATSDRNELAAHNAAHRAARDGSGEPDADLPEMEESYDPDVDPHAVSAWVPEQQGRRRSGRSMRGKLCRTGVAPYQVAVTMDLDTLLGLAENPAILEGSIPVTASVGRRLLYQADFMRLLIDRSDGSLLEKSPHVYRPERALAHFVDSRDVVCTTPGCNKPASRCQIDHITPFNHEAPERGGLTVKDNLHNLCVRAHQLKTHGGFDVEVDADGTKWWVTPLGRRYRMEPYDHRPDS